MLVLVAVEAVQELAGVNQSSSSGCCHRRKVQQSWKQSSWSAASWSNVWNEQGCSLALLTPGAQTGCNRQQLPVQGFVKATAFPVHWDTSVLPGFQHLNWKSSRVSVQCISMHEMSSNMEKTLSFFTCLSDSQAKPVPKPRLVLILWRSPGLMPSQIVCSSIDHHHAFEGWWLTPQACSPEPWQLSVAADKGVYLLFTKLYPGLSLLWSWGPLPDFPLHPCDNSSSLEPAQSCWSEWSWKIAKKSRNAERPKRSVFDCMSRFIFFFLLFGHKWPGYSCCCSMWCCSLSFIGDLFSRLWHWLLGTSVTSFLVKWTKCTDPFDTLKWIQQQQESD